ncbi:MAG TPA: thiamine pyrophosphate-binding protein [Syntrophorhabdaceae bacterium]|mgnify:CR=1 FL=1|nr:thiamine pyrophosphate-binding protein [Syntrophorhabdaceae bacterium]HPU29024.1 thiamine pyrophosphate-binding protein [Syntrophorhabdaceae bacterium]
MLFKDIVVKFLKEKKINDIFYLPGIHTVSLNESFIKYGINVYTGRHESDLMYMADGYTRRTNKTGVVFVTPGPGLGNIVSGCMEAFGDNSSILVFHIDTKRQEHGKGILHELKEPENIFKYFIKKSFYISRIDEILPKLNAAFKETTTERKGPVLISIPFVFLDKELPLTENLLKDQIIETHQRSPNFFPDDAIERIEGILKSRHKPVIIAGKSLMLEEARNIIHDMCMHSSIPFLTTTSGKGIVDERQPYAFGNIIKKGLINNMIKDADIVIAIGTRLRDVDAKRRGVKIRELIHIDIDDTWFGKNYETLIALSGDLLDFLKKLKEITKKRRFDWDLTLLKNMEETEEGMLMKMAMGYKAIKIIRDSIPHETVTVWDLNLISYWAEYYFPVYEQRAFFMPRGISPIFYGLPAGIGAKIGSFETPCLVVCGDGGILPTLCELSFIKNYNIPLVIIVYNNNSFGILEDAIQKRYNLMGLMTLTNPDFVKLANTFGIKGKKTNTLQGLKKILLNIDWHEPYLIEFSYSIFPTPWDI